MKSWYVVHTKPRKETLAENNLRRQAFETFLPWMKRMRRRRGSWVEVVEPLFPRYLFIQIDTVRQSIAPIRSTCGVTSMVTFGGQLHPVPDQVVDLLLQSDGANNGLHKEPVPRFEKGDRVSILSGPFQGLSGIFQALSGTERVLILLDVLGKATSVSLGRRLVTAG